MWQTPSYREDSPLCVIATGNVDLSPPPSANPPWPKGQWRMRSASPIDKGFDRNCNPENFPSYLAMKRGLSLLLVTFLFCAQAPGQETVAASTASSKQQTDASAVPKDTPSPQP